MSYSKKTSHYISPQTPPDALDSSFSASAHAGPTLLTASLGTRYHILSGRKVIRSIVDALRVEGYQPSPHSFQLMGQLPLEHLIHGPVFDTFGIGTVQTKYGHTRKPVIIKSYTCLPLCQSCSSRAHLWSDLWCFHSSSSTIYPSTREAWSWATMALTLS